MSTTALWDRVFKTDPNFVKPITGKDYKGNSPSPHYIVRRLTEEFGPCGIGWGVKILSERMERMGTDDVLHIARVQLWYVHDDKRGEIEQVGQTKACYRTKGDGGYLKVDEDAPKKSVTDALVKCASYLGFAGDIFSGRWDDSAYVADLRREFDPEHQQGRNQWLDEQKSLIFAATNVGELRKTVAAAIEAATRERDADAVTRINAWAEEKKAQAKPKVAA
ncbi:MAG: hypothetical protein KIH64_015045 [Mycobacterium sp.]|nr:hypothetical protein [Mycobacterium sp.]